MTAAAIALDWLIGDPKWPTHPVILIGRLDSLGGRQITSWKRDVSYVSSEMAAS